ncbi:MAG: phosphotransferase [Nitrospira sp.]|nr:phosphotransferase [Nitrospira sp.]
MSLAGQSPWTDQVRSALEAQGRGPVIEYLQRQRWFRGKGRSVADARFVDGFELSSGTVPHVLAILLVEYRGGGQERYAAPLSVRPRQEGDDAVAITALSDSTPQLWVCDATRDDDVWRALYATVGGEREIIGHADCLAGKIMPGTQEEWAAPVDRLKVLSAEQSNTSVVLDRRVIMKLIRKLDMGINPDGEVLEFLTTQTSCRDIPPLLGLMQYHDCQTEDMVAEGTILVVQGFVTNKGDGWNYILMRLEELLNTSKTRREMSDTLLGEIRHLGLVTGRLHLALASNAELEAFRPEPTTDQDVEEWKGKMAQLLADVSRDLRGMPVEQQALIGLSLDEPDRLERVCRARFENLHLLANGHTAKVRCHGDYHLGQVLKTDDGFVVIDFEGEPARPLEERRAKYCPLKDVAGMLRSFNYATYAVLKQGRPISTTDRDVMMEWERAARSMFLEGYREVAKPGEVEFLPRTWEDVVQVLQVYELDKALYELQYELHNRPDWLPIPMQGIRSLVLEEVA